MQALTTKKYNFSLKTFIPDPAAADKNLFQNIDRVINSIMRDINQCFYQRFRGGDGTKESQKRDSSNPYKGISLGFLFHIREVSVFSRP